MALAGRFAGDIKAVSGRTEVNILRLYINGVGIDVGPDGGQIVDLSGQRATDIHLATQMANVFAGRTAITIIRTYLVAALDGIEDPVTAGIDLKILTDIHTCALQDKVALGIDNRVIADIDARQWPQQGLCALDSPIIAAELRTVGAQNDIAPAIQLQVSGS
ncbi:Uncharacterised protein [Yersinia rohdei]|nr:Uncharacterised protein [Yersinia rohdei]